MKQTLLFLFLLANVNVFAQNNFSWSQIANYPGATSEMASCGYNGYVYSFNNCSNELFRYNPSNNKWDTLASLSSPVMCNAGICAKANKLYIVSSHNIGVYNIPTNIWETGRVVAKDETTPAISDDNDDFTFIFPHSFDTTISNGDTVIKKRIDKYNIANQTITSLAYMNTAREKEEAVYLNGKLFSFGGKALNGTVLNTAEVYDFTADTWTNISNTFKYRHSGAAITDGKYIYLFGGESGSGYTKHQDIEVYDPENNSVTTLSVANSMLREGSRFAYGLANGKVVVAGGLTNTPSTNIATNFAEMSNFSLIAEGRRYKELLAFSISNNTLDMSVYPNPSQGIITVNIVNPEQIKRISVYDMSGHCVQINTTNKQSKMQLDLSHLPAGNYSVTAENEKATHAQVIQVVK